MKNTILLLFLVFGISCSVFCQLDSLTASVGSDRYTGIHSILISQRGKLLYEHYFNGWTGDSLHDSRSSFKSITSLLMGIAIDKGFVRDIDQKVYSFFPEYVLSGRDSALKQRMKIRDLLNMESGFDCEEFNDTKDCEEAMVATSDWVHFALDLPMKDAPGTVWAYTSCDPMIIGGIISKTSGLSIMDFASKYLFGPLAITDYHWTVDPSGHGMTAGSFYIRPVDMLKIGELVRQHGVWRDRQIVSASWMRESTRAPIPIPDFSFVKWSRSTVAAPQPARYGCYWYREQIQTRDYAEDVLFASGNGGQYIMVIERLDLVVVFTQGNYGSWKAKRAFDLLARYILPVYEGLAKTLNSNR